MSDLPAISVVVASEAAPGAGDAFTAALAGCTAVSGGHEVVQEPVARGDVGAAWNRAAARARGTLLLFLRDDVRPAANLLTAHLELHDHTPDAVAVGRLAVDDRASLEAHLLRIGGDALDRAFPRPHAPRLLECCGQTLSISRARFAGSTGFAEQLEWGWEAELVQRLRTRGATFLLGPDPVGTRVLPTRVGEIAGALAAAGRASVALFRHCPPLLAELELGGFHSSGEWAVTARRALLAMGGPLTLLSVLTPLFRGGAREPCQRFLTSYFYWRGVWQAADRRLRRELAYGPVVLMYHAIGDALEAPGHYRVPRRAFARQLAWLSLAGYRVIGAEELVIRRANFRLPPARSVAITFDDGYGDNYHLAVPELHRRRFPATFYVVTGCAGASNTWDDAGELAGRPLMTWKQVAELERLGMEVGAHSRRHPALAGRPAGVLDDEVAGSRGDMARALEHEVRTFAYPYGSVDDAAALAVARAGFDGAYCSRSGINDPAAPAYALRRVEVRGTDSLLAFAVAVWRGRRARRGAASASP